MKKIAETARIQLEEEEIVRMGEELERILEHFSEIKDIKAEEEMYYVHENENQLRDDVGMSKDGSKIREQFTSKDKGYLLASKLIK